MKFTVDAGHAGYKTLNPKKVYATPGKRTPDGEPEWEFNNEVVKAYISELSTYEDAQIKRVDDPTGKTDVSLNTRTKIINDWDSDCHLSIHHNAFGNGGDYGTWTGVQTHVYESKPKEASALAKVVQQALVKSYGLRDRGIIYNDLHMTREPKMTSILLEGGFMDSRIDIEKLRDKAVLRKAGKEVAIAVAKYYGLKKKKEVVAKPSAVKENGKTVYRVRKSSGDAKTQKGAFENLNSAKTMANKNAGYKVFDDKGKLIYTPPVPEKIYTVKSGDVLSKIAAKYNTTTKKLQEANNIKDANKIYPGQKIKIK